MLVGRQGYRACKNLLHLYQRWSFEDSPGPTRCNSEKERQLRQEAQLSPRDPRDARYQLKCSTVARITQTDSVSAWAALSATATFYSASCIVLTLVHESLHWAQLSHSEHAMQCVSSTDIRTTNLSDVNWTVTVITDQPTSTTISVVGDTAYYSAKAPLWTWTTAADVHKGFKQQKWLSRSLKVTRNGAIR